MLLFSAHDFSTCHTFNKCMQQNEHEMGKTVPRQILSVTKLYANNMYIVLYR